MRLISQTGDIDVPYEKNQDSVRYVAGQLRELKRFLEEVTGKNIPENELDNIWIKFYKVDKARTRAYGGNGIGLSIVKAIMDRHEKKCGAINRPDGVEFWFELDCNSLEKGTE